MPIRAFPTLSRRDQIAAEFRWQVFKRLGWIPFDHQARWMLPTEGAILTDGPVRDKEQSRFSNKPVVLIQTDGRKRRLRRVRARPEGQATVVANLAAFKTGKSAGGAMWMTGFAAVPGARIQLLGYEYDICVPEFEYLSNALLSKEAGLGIVPAKYYNQPKSGRMQILLNNGASFECRSWDRKDALRGKEIDVYYACEAYQFPGLEVYSSISQNLRMRQGLFIATTTPDRPWVSIFHEEGHGKRPEWCCVCNIAGEANPYTFDQAEKDRDDPAKGGLMTREQFAVSWGGKLGEFVGRVFAFQRGERVFRPDTHPDLWKKTLHMVLSPFDLDIPETYDLILGADTGSFMSAVLLAISPDDQAFALAEWPNYRYVSTTPELLDQTTPEWARAVVAGVTILKGKPKAWADPNTQFRADCAAYGLKLLSNRQGPEFRTEVAREYFQQGRIWFAPWLTILPFELEHATWPKESTAAGKFTRLKRNDHTLDCLEHVLSRRPRVRRARAKKPETFKERYLREHQLQRPTILPDIHLGAG